MAVAREYFRKVKMTRGDVHSRRTDAMRDMEYFRRYDEGCDEPDHRLAELIDAATAGGRESRRG